MNSDLGDIYMFALRLSRAYFRIYLTSFKRES